MIALAEESVCLILPVSAMMDFMVLIVLNRNSVKMETRTFVIYLKL